MRRFAVFVGTTAGPVSIERITREPAARTSMVCLGRSARQLPLSDDYDSFVAAGSGAVARAFGPFPDGGFRMDLSAPVSGGDSWQLAAFVAHAVLADPDARLVADTDDADAVIWLTGAVDYDYAVHPVDHVAEKIHAVNQTLTGWQAEGHAPVLVLPAGANHDEATAALPAGADCRAAMSARDVLSSLGLRMPAGEAGALSAGPVARPRGLRIGLAVLLLLLVLGLAAAWRLLAGDVSGDGLRLMLADRRLAPSAVQKPGAIRLDLIGRRAPVDMTCREVAMEVATARTAPLGNPITGLCGFEAVLSAGHEPRFVAADVIIERGEVIWPEGPPNSLQGAHAAVGPWRWSYGLPLRSAQGLEVVVLAISDHAPVAAAWARLRAADSPEQTAEELRAEGYEVLVRRITLRP